ncbi:MAG: HypC/HybG/HupF family hydrogenase formation chaperone [bacterium]|nr:HypC/HybG/HupF family hydrogenase formation chaperone [bacterium]
MCLGVPMEIKNIEGTTAQTEMSGLKLECDVSLIENPEVGDYVIVHAGYAIERLDPDEAAETLELIRGAIDSIDVIHGSDEAAAQG